MLKQQRWRVSGWFMVVGELAGVSDQKKEQAGVKTERGLESAQVMENAHDGCGVGSGDPERAVETMGMTDFLRLIVMEWS